MPKYTVKSPLRHDQKDYAVGATAELDEQTGQALVASGDVEPQTKPVAVEETKGKGK